jgi:hypothetical protein
MRQFLGESKFRSTLDGLWTSLAGLSDIADLRDLIEEGGFLVYGDTMPPLGDSWLTGPSATDALVPGLATGRDDVPRLNLATRAFTIPRGLA